MSIIFNFTQFSAKMSLRSKKMMLSCVYYELIREMVMWITIKYLSFLFFGGLYMISH